MRVGLDVFAALLVHAGFDPLELIGQLEQFIRQYPYVTSLLLILPTLAFLFYERQRTLRERGEEQRHQYLVDIERRRLSERNMEVQASTRLYHRHEQSTGSIGAPIQPYVVAHVDLHNIGDGPVDMLACLVAGRELDDAQIPGLATQARDVAWNDLVPYFWDVDVAGMSRDRSPLFRGISTTKNITYAPEQLVRLDPKQHEELIRIDALESVMNSTSGSGKMEYEYHTPSLSFRCDRR